MNFVHDERPRATELPIGQIFGARRRAVLARAIRSNKEATCSSEILGVDLNMYLEEGEEALLARVDGLVAVEMQLLMVM